MYIYIITQRGETALMRATSCGRMANVKELIKAKANLDLQDLVCQLTWLCPHYKNYSGE